MRKAILLTAVLLIGTYSFADTIINNFTGYNDYWFPFGDQGNASQTYGEVFTVPDGVNNLTGFSFYTGNPIDSGDIIAGAYIATWTGTHAGSLLYQSGAFNYDNLGNEKLTFSTGGLGVHSGEQYVMFLSTSQFSGQSFGSTLFFFGGSQRQSEWICLFQQWQRVRPPVRTALGRLWPRA